MFLIIAICGYLLGSIPFGYLIGKFLKVDLTKVGSGNIGATNASRALGKKFGALVFILDLLKGSLPALIAMLMGFSPLQIVVIALSPILGHSFSIFMKFSGGKGVATSLGVLLAVAPDIFVFTIITGIFIIFATKYVSLGSIFGSIVAIFLSIIFGKEWAITLLMILSATVIIMKHIENIKRLVAGNENRITGKG